MVVVVVVAGGGSGGSLRELKFFWVGNGIDFFTEWDFTSVRYLLTASCPGLFVSLSNSLAPLHGTKMTDHH